jgi:N-methylhydantoinase B
MAEPHYDMGVAISVISGVDSRHGKKPYVTQLISGVSGSAGVNGHDGYLHHAISNGGMFFTNSVEMIERAYPILYLEQEVMRDGIGSGKWDGGPSIKTVIRTLNDPVTFVYMGDGHENPSRGAAGGRDGVPAQAYLCAVKNGVETEILQELPTIHEITVQPGQAIMGIYSSAGGYGDPLERDPERVKHRVREGWLSTHTAREVYGVQLDTAPELYVVKYAETEQLRKQLKSK